MGRVGAMMEEMMEINSLMQQINGWLKDILKDNYVGVYFHGSLRLGSFHPNRSDLDFIIVVKDKLDSEAKELIWDKMLENVDAFPEGGFEFSVVLYENCQIIKHPIPYELHGSRAWIDRYRADKATVINGDYKADPDLASHFNVINVPNEKMDFGRPSQEVFAKVPMEYVIDSNYRDTLECVEEIVNHPVYCVLNLCRFYALIRDGLTLSKYDGGRWALENMNSDYEDVIKAAMDEYGDDAGGTFAANGTQEAGGSHAANGTCNACKGYDAERLRGFAREAITRIDGVLTINTLQQEGK